MRRRLLMNHRKIRLAVLVLATVTVGWGTRESAGDWPTHRGDAGRTGFRSVDPGFPLAPVWRHEAAAPRPAWGPPARRSYWQRLEHLEPRVADDHAFPVILAGDAVLFGSSAEDQVRCLDAATGAVRWIFWTDGPVRYAPAVADGRVYFGSDDGAVYAVRLEDGRELWRHRAGPEDWRIPGNGRLISSWPARTGVLVEGGVVFGTAGLYPQQGAFAFALDAVTGAVRWQQPFSESPEGHLLASGRLVIVPTGRASPVGLDRGSGLTVRSFDTGGGTYAVASGDELFGGPANQGTLTGVATPSGQRLVTVRGRNLVAAGRHVYLLDAGELKAVDRTRQAALERRVRGIEARIRPLQESERAAARKAAGPAGSAGAAGAAGTAATAELTALRAELDKVRDELPACVLWRVDCLEDLCLIGTGTALVAGGSNRVSAFDRGTGRRLWDAPVRGRALALAATDGRLVVSTDLGVIESFGRSDRADRAPATASVGVGVGVTRIPTAPGLPGTDAKSRERVDQLMAAGLPGRGYVLVAGLGSGRLLMELVRRTELGVVAMDPDAERVASWRERLAAAGLFGTRVAVHTVGTGSIPFTDFFANALVAERVLEEGGRSPWPDAEMDRVVRPFGGIRWTDPSGPPVSRGPLDGAGEWTHQFGNPANTASSGDRRVHAGLRLQWFGGPGPDVMVDRHLRAPAPLSAGGRLFVPGENRMLAVDAYNGTDLWERELPGSQRYSMPYDAGYQSIHGDRLAVAVRDACWLIRAGDGVVTQRWPVPALPGDGAASGVEDGHWGYVALTDGGLFGSVQRATASRTRPGYEQIDVDYNNDQPTVTGLSVFRMDPETGRVVWHRRRGVVLNTTLTLHAGMVVLVEARAPALARHSTGRIALPALMGGEPWLVALDAGSGEVRWERPIDGALAASRNILYLSGTADRLILAGSVLGAGNDTRYLVECRRAADGAVLWTGDHGASKPGEFTHGEQVHHPVVLGDLLVAEPVAYELAAGRRLPMPGGTDDWLLIRPGHSCGTISGAGDCLFFRANNPTVMDLRASLRSSGETARKLAPSRAGCWINMIPAGGLLLVPEASAGCVCQYSLQTSMAFLPWPARGR